MISSVSIILGGALLGGAGFKTYSLVKRDYAARANFLEKGYDKNKNLQISHHPLLGSNTVFSLCHDNAIFNNLKIYKNELSEEVDVAPVVASRGAGMAFYDRLEITEHKVFNKTWRSDEITFAAKPLNLNKIKILFKNVNDKTLTINDFNKLAPIAGNLPLNLTRYKEKTICNGDEYYRVVHNSEVEVIGFHKKDIEDYLVVHYPWTNTCSPQLFWIAAFFCILYGLFQENEKK